MEFDSHDWKPASILIFTSASGTPLTAPVRSSLSRRAISSSQVACSSSAGSVLVSERSRRIRANLRRFGASNSAASRVTSVQGLWHTSTVFPCVAVLSMIVPNRQRLERVVILFPFIEQPRGPAAGPEGAGELRDSEDALAAGFRPPLRHGSLRNRETPTCLSGLVRRCTPCGQECPRAGWMHSNERVSLSALLTTWACR